MKSKFFIIILLVLSGLFSCNNSTDNQPKETVADTALYVPVVKNNLQYDSLLNAYINYSKSELLSFSRNDKNIKTEALFDRKKKTDTAEYHVYRIGHNVAEDDSSDYRFVTDSWVYINSSTHKLYEYDMLNECLIDPF